MTTDELKRLAAQIKALTEAVRAEPLASVSGGSTASIRRTFQEAWEHHQAAIADLDPIKQPAFVLDPASPTILGRLVGIALVAQERIPMNNVGKFYGSGVYAIYYRGAFPAYKVISRQEHPIYVGKADPQDSHGKTATEQGYRLARRLEEHRRNLLKPASTLRVEDFEYKALVVQSGWQTPAEDYLIRLFHPIWNNEVNICYGFGKHGDSADTRSNKRSPWDTLHPGRTWAGASKLEDAKSKHQIMAEIDSHFKGNPPFRSVDAILKQFLAEMSTPS